LEPIPVGILSRNSISPEVELKEGPLKKGQIKDLFPFKTTIVQVEISGEFIYELLIRNFSCIGQKDFLIFHNIDYDYVFEDGTDFTDRIEDLKKEKAYEIFNPKV
jgi:2',3'-cyclic-nucleotide 2'-phosphodiesterase (5'-nucleotidase family)